MHVHVYDNEIGSVWVAKLRGSDAVRVTVSTEGGVLLELDIPIDIGVATARRIIRVAKRIRIAKRRKAREQAAEAETQGH